MDGNGFLKNFPFFTINIFAILILVYGSRVFKKTTGQVAVNKAGQNSDNAIRVLRIARILVNLRRKTLKSKTVKIKLLNHSKPVCYSKTTCCIDLL